MIYFKLIKGNHVQQQSKKLNEQKWEKIPTTKNLQRKKPEGELKVAATYKRGCFFHN